MFCVALETQQKKSHTKTLLQSRDIVSSSGYIQKVVNITQDSKGNQAEIETLFEAGVAVEERLE